MFARFANETEVSINQTLGSFLVSINKFFKSSNYSPGEIYAGLLIISVMTVLFAAVLCICCRGVYRSCCWLVCCMYTPDSKFATKDEKQSQPLIAFTPRYQDRPSFKTPRKAPDVNYGRIFDEIDTELKIGMRHLRFETQIGKGHYGVLYLARYTPLSGDAKDVACKMLKEGISGVREFFTEGITMGKLKHTRVLELIGISFTADKIPVIISEYMPNGDLLTHLRNRNITLTMKHLMQFAIQIAEGMEFLHSKNFIHRDLAARNCMLDDSMEIKIADFGLARRCNERKEYLKSKERELPIKWMPIEALKTSVFTWHGDVWAYGVVLWELMTRGKEPYDNSSSYQVFQYVASGRQLERPKYCPEQLYDNIMLKCWAPNMDHRPPFTVLIYLINDYLRNRMKQ